MANNNNNFDISKATEILYEFEKIPKKFPEPTFLEITRYPSRRFEEIISRILKFYLNPNEEHKLHSLFIDSLFEILEINNIEYKNSEIDVKTEVHAGTKRIDIVIKGEDFVIGIENKIYAKLYNQLDIYNEKLKSYNKGETKAVILSLKKISDKNEQKKIRKNNFNTILYVELFEILKEKIGQYLANANQKYVTFLFDFIQTLENMTKQNIMEPEIMKFFYKNENSILELISHYNKFKVKVADEQKRKIEEILPELKKTNDKWFAHKGLTLIFNSFNDNKPKIGIEAWFKKTENNPLGKFEINIRTWGITYKTNWGKYRNTIRFKIKEIDGNCKGNNKLMEWKEIKKGDANRRLLVCSIFNDHSNYDAIQKQIIIKLKKYYYLLDEIMK